MDSVIKLWPGQNQAIEFDHQLLNEANKYKLPKERYEIASTQEKQLSYMWLVRRIVGRYLYHWPVTEFLLDDMVSEGLLALCEQEDLSDEKKLMDRIQYKIEVMLNDNRAIVRSSHGTNRNRQRNKEELEYRESFPLHNIGKIDMELKQAELLDNLSDDDRQMIIETRYEQD